MARRRGLEPLVAAVAAEQGGARYGPMVTERLVRRPPPPEPRATPPAPSEPASPDRLSPSQLEELIRRLRGEAPALPEVTAALEMQPGDFSPAPFANGPDWVVFQVTERATPRREDLDAETRASIEARLLEAGRRERLLELGVELRAAADAAGCLWMTDDPVEAARTRLRAR